MLDNNRAALRAVLKRTLPRPMTQSIAVTANYGRRLVAWLRVLRSVRGRTSADRRVLRRSAMRAPFDALADIGEWREPMLLTDAEIGVSGLGAFAIRGGSDDLGHVLLATHADIFRVIGAHLKPGDVAIDAGANIGVVTVFMARLVGPHGHTIAVEMMPDTAARLRHNVALNGLEAVEVVEQALSDCAGKKVHAQVADGLFGQASIANVTNPQRALRRVEVETTTLDALTKGVETIAIMKMDLEGAEPQALAGAGEMLQRTRAVVFESWARDGGRTSSILTAAGFAITAIDGLNFLATRVEMPTRASGA
ncbi:methyltransferase FkbM family [Rhodomicrobium vannielii ATCC 17100]|uniref:Methyltransferase FkbM family n=1 Tax=Rhodomicrobium vannielii (strain ATCC 17100 / DSM 162 / LMG 4299 / NCIMB 10020 / ATH 3.1.1) TaxID=648757 RepID=E3I7S2_RHOVT|nr:FkbM family methyltransferase [Rhodomicrobium vannielii]ADP69688.1 methyltransferase FkbM family [Rhodomicrobium vannielii ATCC 17100]